MEWFIVLMPSQVNQKADSNVISKDTVVDLISSLKPSGSCSVLIPGQLAYSKHRNLSIGHIHTHTNRISDLLCRIIIKLKSWS